MTRTSTSIIQILKSANDMRKAVKLPVYSYSGQTLKKGDVLGTVKEMRCIIRYMPGKENIISGFISPNGINDDPIQILSVVLDHVKFTSKEILEKQMKDNDILQMLSYLQTGKEV